MHKHQNNPVSPPRAKKLCEHSVELTATVDKLKKKKYNNFRISSLSCLHKRGHVLQNTPTLLHVSLDDYEMTISGYEEFIERLMANSVATNKGRQACWQRTAHTVYLPILLQRFTLLFFLSSLCIVM